MDTAFEVTVTGKNGSSDQVVVNNAILDGFGDLTRVTDASHATVTGSGVA